MIKSLEISNYALIESLHIQFDKGLNIITGETGAGKSILLGALGLIMGRRADTKSLFDESQKCHVEVRYDIKGYGLSSFFEDHDLDYDEDLIVRREIVPSGKSRAFVNDTPVTLEVLTLLSGELIDLHQQFDTLQLAKPAFQISVIDALAQNQEILDKYQSGYKQYKSIELLLLEKRKRLAEQIKEQEYYTFLQTELFEAQFVAGEQEELEELQKVLSNAEGIKATSAEIFNKLTEEELSILNQLRDLYRSASQLANVDKRFESLSGRINSILEEVKDISGEFEGIYDTTEFNEAEIARVDERLNLLYRLFKKHNSEDLTALLETQKLIDQKLDDLDSVEGEIKQLEKQRDIIFLEISNLAKHLSDRRQSEISGFEEQVKIILSSLAMPNASLLVDQKITDSLGPKGMDQISFLFSANKGGRPAPIKDVASGGETSRVTLAVKSVVAAVLQFPTMIFDEIDTGISGAVADQMGVILRNLSERHQVISITHSPQIAAKANSHYFVYKNEEGARTKSSIKQLQPEERITELAKMLSGERPSEAAYANARAMLGIV